MEFDLDHDVQMSGQVVVSGCTVLGVIANVLFLINLKVSRKCTQMGVSNTSIGDSEARHTKL